LPKAWNLRRCISLLVQEIIPLIKGLATLFGINPRTYLRNMLTKLSTNTAEQLHTLLPIK
jgi:hypothetical protein